MARAGNSQQSDGKRGMKSGSQKDGQKSAKQGRSSKGEKNGMKSGQFSNQRERPDGAEAR